MHGKHLKGCDVSSFLITDFFETLMKSSHPSSDKRTQSVTYNFRDLLDLSTPTQVIHKAPLAVFLLGVGAWDPDTLGHCGEDVTKRHAGEPHLPPTGWRRKGGISPFSFTLYPPGEGKEVSRRPFGGRDRERETGPGGEGRENPTEGT